MCTRCAHDVHIVRCAHYVHTRGTLYQPSMHTHKVTFSSVHIYIFRGPSVFKYFIPHHEHYLCILAPRCTSQPADGLTRQEECLCLDTGFIHAPIWVGWVVWTFYRSGVITNRTTSVLLPMATGRSESGRRGRTGRTRKWRSRHMPTIVQLRHHL